MKTGELAEAGEGFSTVTSPALQALCQVGPATAQLRQLHRAGMPSLLPHVFKWSKGAGRAGLGNRMHPGRLAVELA